jgi:DNA-directed RNA polymerase subunit M/transcription elongation factor TFIIS
MTNIIILDKNGKSRTSDVESYSTKELLQIMKNKNNKLKLTKGESDPKILLSLNIDNFQIHLLGWNSGDKNNINKQFEQIISNNKKRINTQIHSDYYGDLIVIKTTLSTKILNMSYTEYESILDILNNTKKSIKKADKKHGKNDEVDKLKANKENDKDDEDNENDNYDEDEEEDEEEDDEQDEDEEDDEEECEEKDDEEQDGEHKDEEDDEDASKDNIYNDKNLKKKFQELDNEQEDDEEDDEDDEDEAEEDEAEENVNDNYDENDDLDNDDGPDEDFAPIDVESLDVELEKKHKNTRKQKKMIDLDIYSDMLAPEKKGNIKNKLNTIRHKCMELINTLVNDTKISRHIEQGVYNYCVLDSFAFDTTPRWDNNVFSSMYINKIRSIYTNLNSKSYLNNINFIQKFKDCEYDPYDLAFLKPYEMYPERWEKIREDEYRRNQLLYQTKEVAMTDEYKCRRCKKRETSYFELQIRSADEPATLFITCINCGNRWTKNP